MQFSNDTINVTEKTFAIIISGSGCNSTSQWNITICNQSRGMPLVVQAVVAVDEGIKLTMPVAVEVAEGETAHLCIAAKFPSCSLAQQLMVKLRVQDISTSKC